MAPQLQKISANYDHIILTEEEEQSAIAFGIHHFKKNKADEIYKQQYLKKLREPKVYRKLSCQELRSVLCSKYNIADVADEHLLKEYRDRKIKPFILDESNRDIFNLLCQYFSDDIAFEKDGHSLEKGIMLFGPVGCGKTSLMKMFAFNTSKPFGVISCRTIADKYSKDGSNALLEFSNMPACYPEQNFGLTSLGRCFDDLGTEDSKKNFGNEVNVMQDVIFKIYDNELIGNFHITTNLSGSEIEEAYGSRIRSRLREMMNVLTFDKNSKDRRA